MKRSEKMRNQLGMTLDCAKRKLMKSLLFKLSKKQGVNLCYRCDLPIEDISQFSIDHKINWLHKDNAAELFLDVENIAFSHLLCNIKAGGKPPKIHADKNAGARAMYQRSKDDGRYEKNQLRRKIWRQKRREAGLPYT